MKKLVCIPLIIINFVFIFAAILTERYVYPGIYKTTLFWGISLYALVCSCIILINERDFPVMMWINTAITIIAIVWFFLYLPKYSKTEALNIISTDGRYQEYSMIADPVKPVESTNISNFIKGSYRFIASNNPGISIVFNPVSGKYDLSYSNDADVIPPSKNTSPLDISFEEEYNLIADNDNYKKFELLLKYKNRWLSELEKNYNKLYNVLTDENKALFNNEMKKWRDSYESEKTFDSSVFSQRYADSVNIDMYILENSMYQIRDKALELLRIYDKIN